MKFLACLFSILCAGSVWAADSVSNLGTFGDWTAYVYKGEDGKVCYMASEPEKSVGKYKKRDDIFLMVTHRPAEHSFDVVNTIAGYTYKKGSTPSLTIDKKKAVNLAVNKDSAWAKDAQTDKKLVASMKGGSQAVLKGTSVRGTATTDTFSLKGFSKAYRAISEACGQ